MEFRDLKKQYQILKGEMDRAVLKVMQEGQYIGGPMVTQLEAELAKRVGVKHSIACANGTDALLMVLKAWGVEPGDAVFVPDFTFYATAEVVKLAGAVPVFVDVEESSFNLSPESLERAISAVRAEGRLTPRGVIPVDLFGLPADYEGIESVAAKYKLWVLEDGAQSFGSTYKGAPGCSFGDAAATSFFPAKPLGCYGDGGAIFTDSDDLAATLYSIRSHGQGDHKYHNVRVGLNSRLDSIQAAVLQVKLGVFEQEMQTVRKIAGIYDELLHSHVSVPLIPEHSTSVYAQYTIRLEGGAETRNRLQKDLSRQGIPTAVYYPIPLHQQPVFQNEVLYEECSVSKKLCVSVLSLPIHPYLDAEEAEKISSAIISHLTGTGR